MANVIWDTVHNGGTSWGGTGVWNTTIQNFGVDPTFAQTSFSNGDHVTFGYIGGAVTVSEDITVSGMFFNGNGYDITGTHTLTVQAGGLVKVNSGNQARISATLTGANDFNVEGLLQLTGNNTNSGTITVTNGTLYIGGTHLGDVALGGFSKFQVNSGGTMHGDFHSASGITRIYGEMAGDINFSSGSSGHIWVLGSGELSGTVIGNDLGNNVEINLGTTGSGDLRLRGDTDTVNVAGTLTGTVRMGKGDDVLNAQTGTLTGAVVAGPGNDTVTGSDNDNLLRGSGGNDTLLGRGGKDRLEGGKGRDIIDGGDGNDLIYGDGGKDVLTGGAGNDVFMFRTLSDLTGGGPRERITDFTQGEDRIRLKGIDADVNTVGDDAFTFIGTAGFSGTAGELRMEHLGGATVIRGDVDGDGATDFALSLDGVIMIVATDFML